MGGVVDGRITVCSGFDRQRYATKICKSLNPKTGEWETFPEMKHTKAGATAASTQHGKFDASLAWITLFNTCMQYCSD